MSCKLLKLFGKRAGQIGRKLKSIMDPVSKEDDVDLPRECVLKAMCVYLNEDPQNLLRDYMVEDKDVIQGAIEETTVGIYVIKELHACDTPEDIGIVLEGHTVLQDLDNVALAAAMLFGLMYALNLNYPSELKYTFEVLQKVVMELERNTLSNKAQTLKNKLFQ